jgi:Fe-S oxidoreductase
MKINKGDILTYIKHPDYNKYPNYKDNGYLLQLGKKYEVEDLSTCGYSINEYWPMFKDAEQGNKEVNLERADDMLDSNANIVAAACPFCMTMLRDGVKHHNKEAEIEVKDIAELVASAVDL